MKFIKSFGVALLGSIAANLAILFALRPFVINPAMPFGPLTVPPVVMFSVIGVTGATIVYALMRRFFANPNKPYVWLSAVVLLVSFIPDYLIIGVTTGNFAGGTWATASTMALMHVATAAITVWSLTRVWGARPPQPAKA